MFGHRASGGTSEIGEARPLLFCLRATTDANAILSSRKNPEMHPRLHVEQIYVASLASHITQLPRTTPAACDRIEPFMGQQKGPGCGSGPTLGINLLTATSGNNTMAVKSVNRNGSGCNKAVGAFDGKGR